eukprot:4045318-Amphidinium_carterae.1
MPQLHFTITERKRPHSAFWLGIDNGAGPRFDAHSLNDAAAEMGGRQAILLMMAVTYSLALGTRTHTRIQGLSTSDQGS